MTEQEIARLCALYGVDLYRRLDRDTIHATEARLMMVRGPLPQVEDFNCQTSAGFYLREDILQETLAEALTGPRRDWWQSFSRFDIRATRIPVEDT